MVSHCNAYLDLAHSHTMNDHLVENRYYSSLSPSNNFDINNKLLSNRTKANEVWRKMEHQDKNNVIPFEKQQGANTIEELLLKVGWIGTRPLMAFDPAVVVLQQDDWFKGQMMQQGEQRMGMRVQNGGFDNDDINGNGSTMMVPMVRSSFMEESMEETVERRRKRMIKNRESAARSRARKQAHTKQLEIKVLELKKTNSLLKKCKEALKHLPKHSTSEPRYQLRRTSSTSF